MDGGDLGALVEAGGNLLLNKWFTTSLNCLWIYDYLLTLGDEIKYAWSTRGSWIFALFIANRYTPALYIIWVNIVMFHYSDSTKWITILNMTVVTTFAQIAITLRIYAVTRRNKLFAGSLFLLIAAQLGFGLFSTIRIGPGPPPPMPDINLDEFKVCFSGRWLTGELVAINLATAFDVFAFLIISVTAWRVRGITYPGIPSLLNTIRRDATVYFLVVLGCQLMVELFVFFAPEQIHMMSAMANGIIIPIMASRLMLSLKKAAAEPTGLWSLATMESTNRRMRSEDDTLHFASKAPGEPHQISEITSLPDGGAIELGSMSKASRGSGFV